MIDCENRIRNIAGLVGAVNGDVEDKIRELIRLYNLKSWQVENCVVALRCILEENDIEIIKKHAEIAMKKLGIEKVSGK